MILTTNGLIPKVANKICNEVAIEKLYYARDNLVTKFFYEPGSSFSSNSYRMKL
jgi:hypothetical protein